MRQKNASKHPDQSHADPHRVATDSPRDTNQVIIPATLGLLPAAYVRHAIAFIVAGFARSRLTYWFALAMTNDDCNHPDYDKEKRRPHHHITVHRKRHSSKHKRSERHFNFDKTSGLSSSTWHEISRGLPR